MNFQAKKLFLKLIGIYQIIFSPDQGVLRRRTYGGVCRFYPTCSEYARQAVEKYGILKGMGLGIKRILKCHPWHKGGYDPVK